MTELETLLAIESIKQLKARYFRCVDTKDWDNYRKVFADDVRFDISEDMPEGGIVEGAENAVRIARDGLSGKVVSVHHGHTPEIAITSETTATGIWAMEDMLRWEPGPSAPIQSLHGYGHYIETYSKIGAEWRIQTMKLTRLRVDVTGWNDDNG